MTGEELIANMIAKGGWRCVCGMVNHPGRVSCRQPGCRRTNPASDEKAAEMVAAFKPLADAAQKLASPCKDEATLQAECDRVLVRAGYHRLTENNLASFAMAEIAGWFLHVRDSRGECCLPDLVVFDANMTRCLCVELKANAKANIRRGQKAAIQRRMWKLAFTVDEFAGFLADWTTDA